MPRNLSEVLDELLDREAQRHRVPDPAFWDLPNMDPKTMLAELRDAFAADPSAAGTVEHVVGLFGEAVRSSAAPRFAEIMCAVALLATIQRNAPCRGFATSIGALAESLAWYEEERELADEGDP